MVVRRRKKSVKQRAERTRGWGFSKSHRGKGHQGGHGASNVGKRGGSRKTKFLALGIKPYGAHGAKVSSRLRHKANANLKAITTLAIQEQIATWVSKKLAENNSGTYVLDLNKLKYSKIISKGKLSIKLNVTCRYCSKGALKSIEDAGGMVVIAKSATSKPSAKTKPTLKN